MARPRNRAAAAAQAARQAGFRVVRADISGGCHIVLDLERHGRTRRVFAAYSPSCSRGALNHRAFLRRLAREMDAEHRAQRQKAAE